MEPHQGVRPGLLVADPTSRMLYVKKWKAKSYSWKSRGICPMPCFTKTRPKLANVVVPCSTIKSSVMNSGCRHRPDRPLATVASARVNKF